MTDEPPAPPADRPTDRRRPLTRRALGAGGGLAAVSAVAAVAGCTTTPRPAPPTGGTTATPRRIPGIRRHPPSPRPAARRSTP